MAVWKIVFLWSLNFANAESYRPLRLPRCSCIIIVNMHWSFPLDIWFVSLTDIFGLWHHHQKTIFDHNLNNFPPIFMMLSFWIDCRWVHIFLIYTLAINVGQCHVVAQTKYAIIGSWAKGKLQAISKGKSGETFPWWSLCDCRYVIPFLPLYNWKWFSTD